MPTERDAPWNSAAMVAGFRQSPPNDVLLRYARGERARWPGRARVLDIGCGAGRNAIPLGLDRWEVLGVDLSMPMLEAAVERRRTEGAGGHTVFARAAMQALPVVDRSVELVVAHGIWNLAASGAEFRQAVAEAARVAVPGAGLFLFTFSRNTFPPDVRPVAGETYVFTEFSGHPQCFLTADQLLAVLAEAGFAPDPAVPLTEYNLPRPGALPAGGPPVIYEAAFRRQASPLGSGSGPGTGV